MNFVTSKEEIISYFNSKDEVKRLKELEHLIDKDDALKNKINELKSLQQKMINSKEYNLINQYKEDKRLYDELLKEINDYPFMGEYLDLLELVNNELRYLTDGINEEIDKLINR